MFSEENMSFRMEDERETRKESDNNCFICLLVEKLSG